MVENPVAVMRMRLGRCIGTTLHSRQMVHDTARDGKVEAVRCERVSCDKFW